MEINLYRIIERTKVAGPGYRFCLWVQGCSRHCEGCMAVETWPFDKGTPMETDDILDLIVKTPSIEGITCLGGEPFEQAEAVGILAKKVKARGLSVTVFTGYIYDELIAKNDNKINCLLEVTDLLIDGPFIQEQFDLSRPWVGSANQRYHFLTDRYSKDDLKDINNQIEVRISSDGKVLINGMGNFDKISRII
jgi:anaerobic ribonucleoside-triphosphate reductase activating protein